MHVPNIRVKHLRGDKLQRMTLGIDGQEIAEGLTFQSRVRTLFLEARKARTFVSTRNARHMDELPHLPVKVSFMTSHLDVSK